MSYYPVDTKAKWRQNKAKGKGKQYKGAKTRRAPARTVLARRPELKGMDKRLVCPLIPITTNDNTYGYSLNLVRAGTGSWNRIGRKIAMKSLRIKGRAQISYTTTTSTGDVEPGIMRMVVVFDAQPSGGPTPSFDSIFGETDQAGGEVTYFDSMPKYDNMDRYTVLRDLSITASPDAALPTSGGTSNRNVNTFAVDEYIKLGDREVVYSGDSSPMTIADVSTGAVYVYFRCWSQIGVNQWSFTGNTRLRYTDN